MKKAELCRIDLELKKMIDELNNRENYGNFRIASRMLAYKHIKMQEENYKLKKQQENKFKLKL